MKAAGSRGRKSQMIGQSSEKTAVTVTQGPSDYDIGFSCYSSPNRDKGAGIDGHIYTTFRSCFVPPGACRQQHVTLLVGGSAVVAVTRVSPAARRGSG